MEQKTKKILFLICFSVMLLPFLQLCTNIVESAGLYGDYTNSPDVNFSWAKWWDGSYQQGKAAYVNDQGGFRRDLVRANNQVDYWLFKKLHCNSVVLGKNNCLYQPDYINAYYGRDFIGKDSALHQIMKLKAIQDTLARMGKTLVLAYSPCKAFYYPDDFPDDLKCTKAGPTNYQTFLQLADSLHLNQIDFNAWFLKIKQTSKDVLYPREGIHWSVYGALLAADSLTRYMEQLRHTKMQHMGWTSLRHSSRSEDTDEDVFKALNLIFPIYTDTFTYPEMVFKEDSTRTKPKVIYIGDSFCINWIHDNYMQFSNTNWEFWFYFHQIINQNNRDNPDGWIPINNYDWIGKIKSTDCIVIMYTSHNLHQLGNGFIEQAYAYFYPERINIK
jgi:hypothetical protein